MKNIINSFFKSSKIFKFGDIIIYIIFIIIFSIFFIVIVSNKPVKYSNKQVYVYFKNKLTYKFALTKNKHIFFLKEPLGHSTLEINNYKAYIIKSSCPQKICIREGKISHVGQFIICLPNRIIIKIVGKKINHFDGII